jgi:DNA mismatch repair protein MutS
VPFRSVLFGDADAGADGDARVEPEFFRDLNLDQVVRAVVAGKDAYNLTPFFFSPLNEVEAVVYRQEVFRDLERPELYDLVERFAKADLVAHFASQVHTMRRDDRGFGHYHRARGFLNAASQYCDAIAALASGLAAVGVRSCGLLGLHDYLSAYVGSDAFVALQAEARRLVGELDAVRYSFLLKGNRITVGRYDDEVDYSAQVATTFERFQQGAVTSYLPDFRDWDDYVAIGVLHLVAKVYPRLFGELDAFCTQHAAYLDRVIGVFDRELQFYLSYLGYIGPLRENGLVFSYPRLSTEAKDEQAVDTFDLALAAQLSKQGVPVVCNDIVLTGTERILVVSGPNNGGKTTLARTFGQLHYLARLGCPVPGRDVRLFLCDQLFACFEREEDITTLTGKLQDELDRLHAALRRATPDSVFILNEMFNSTTAQDALFLSREILGRVSELDSLCVCVTFLDELATLNNKTVSMVSTVRADDPAIRTYKLIRKPADGRAYARAIAEKYGLTYDQLTGRAG